MIKLKQLLKEDEAENELKAILKKDYVSFLKALGDNITDPKFVAAIKSLSNKLPITATPIEPVVKTLRPTQNEVVLTNSLSFVLGDATSVKNYLSGGVAAPKGESIVTANGEYVIDGHHRWSQVYCINPETKIKALDLPIKDPMNALKATQLGIAGQIEKKPEGDPGGGINLFTIDEATLKKYVVDTIKDDVVEAFKSAGKGDTKEAVADYIWGNVQILKENSKPVDNAPERPLMPQTYQAPNFVDDVPHTDKVTESKKIKLMSLLSIK